MHVNKCHNFMEKSYTIANVINMIHEKGKNNEKYKGSEFESKI